ncbi:MAG TPA: sulfite reductase subunit alpha [Opitutaceae bacterium]|nr:sulfite reductase subunit alpha [Opitutaceae bacterium]
MHTVPVIPESAPFTLEQRAWLNGYLAGLFSRGNPPAARATAPERAPQARPLVPLTILFGSQTGTAEGLAKKAAKDAGKRGFAASIVDMAQTDLSKLATERNLLVIVSTYGDGEPPDSAKALHASLATTSDGTLHQVRYSVCALGDTNYPLFCQCGKEFDQRLEQRGGTRIAPRVDCDLDYEPAYSSWLDTALSAFASPANRAGVSMPSPVETRHSDRPDPTSAVSSSAETAYSRQRPFPARILTCRTLNTMGSAKQVNHIEFDLGGSGLTYEAGDALGVYPQNCPDSVSALLAATGLDGEEAVLSPEGESLSLRRALSERLDLGKPGQELLALFPNATQRHHVIDVVTSASVATRHLAAETLVSVLKKLQPRLYSISSSPKTSVGQVHLTVGAVRYEAEARLRKGVCSTFLTDRVLPGKSVARVFVHTNASFRPPTTGDTPIIMIGPGTGIAPFRAFLQERRLTGARGKNWLFFGDQRASTDFLYQDELQDFQKEGHLTRLDLAFSRDQPEKIYVQHRMMETAQELWAWLEAGAHVYVCGDACRMAKDVDAALHTVVEKAGGRSRDAAADYVQELIRTRRYLRDVY